MSKPENRLERARARAALLEGLAERVGLHANARMVYGDAVARDGVTVIPVAKVAYGFGAGSGDGEKGDGGGGGGGVKAAPLGYIELKNGVASFRRITDPLAYVPLILAGGVAGAILIRGLHKLLHRDRGLPPE